jgi:hypothetical protein
MAFTLVRTASMALLVACSAKPRLTRDPRADLLTWTQETSGAPVVFAIEKGSSSLAQGKSWALLVREDGTVEFLGKQKVRDQGSSKWRIPLKRLETLRQHVQHIWTAEFHAINDRRELMDASPDCLLARTRGGDFFECYSHSGAAGKRPLTDFVERLIFETGAPEHIGQYDDP